MPETETIRYSFMPQWQKLFDLNKHISGNFFDANVNELILPSDDEEDINDA